MEFKRVTVNPRQLGGVPCLRALRIPVATIVALVAEGQSTSEILALYLISKRKTSAKRCSSLPRRSENVLYLSPPVNEVLGRQRPVASPGDPAGASRSRRPTCSSDRIASVGRCGDLRSRCGRGSNCRLRRHGLRDAARHSLGSETVGDSVRGQGSRKPEALALAILSNLPQLVDALQGGSIVTFEPSRVRVRALPINVAPEQA